MKTQYQMYRDAEKQLADANAAFMEMVNHPDNPMTREDLQSLIARRPDRYKRFENFLDVLPSSTTHK